MGLVMISNQRSMKYLSSKALKEERAKSNACWYCRPLSSDQKNGRNPQNERESRRTKVTDC